MFDFTMTATSGTAEGQQVAPKIISGIHGLQLKIGAIVDDELRRVIYQAFMDIYSNFPTKTGATVENLKFEELGNGHYRVVAYPNVDKETGKSFNVIMAIEYGTRAHGPVTANALRFIGDDGEVVYTKWVRGIPAHYIVRFAIERMKKEIRQLPQRVVSQV